jgi:homoserine O-acetyltransferase
MTSAAIACTNSSPVRRAELPAFPPYRPEGMDLAHTRFFTLPHHLMPFRLDSGETLHEITVAYETWGALAPARNNAVLVLHALTGGAHAGPHPETETPAPEPWWGDLIGPGRAIDTDRFFVICPNILGGCYGSTGPMSINPETGAPYRMSFPLVTVRDMVRVQAALCDHFGITRLHAVVGGSLGGMQALQWGVTFPERAHAVIAIGASGRFHAQGIAYNEVGRRAIMADPKWRGGGYPYDDPPRDGFAIARMVGMITYQCDEGMQARFGRNPATRPSRHPAFGGKFDVEGYLHYQGDGIARRFDPNSYLYLTRAMDLFDLGNGFPSYTDALRRLTMPLLMIGISSDILFPPGHVRGVAEEVRALGGDAHYWELVSPDGHDAFLKEFDAMTPVLRRFLQSGAEGG